MADEPKPYRVYKGGRVRARSPSVVTRERPPRKEGATTPPAPPTAPGRSRRRYVLWALVVLLGLILLAVAWSVAGYFSVRSGVSTANKRLDKATRAALTPQNGSLLSHASDILILGTDHADLAARATDQHSDSIMLVRSDPSHHRIIYLTIPRDLRVDIPGQGTGKVNAAMQIGGPALAVRTIESLTGLPVNHVVVVDFGQFEKLIDRVGGVTINVPKPILSNRFDCPYATQARCQAWPGWRFAKGRQHMNGHQALIYSRIRENRLNPAENDVTRGERQQQVLQALTSKLASFGTYVKLPFIGGDLLAPLTTDLSTKDLIELGWVKFRAPGGRTLHCRLGGSPTDIGGVSYIVGTQENIAVIHMVTGDSAPQPPPPGTGSFGPGCVVGSQSFRDR
jgi:LCP family protein required for cell wall assembly